MINRLVWPLRCELDRPTSRCCALVNLQALKFKRSLRTKLCVAFITVYLNLNEQFIQQITVLLKSMTTTEINIICNYGYIHSPVGYRLLHYSSMNIKCCSRLPPSADFTPDTQPFICRTLSSFWYASSTPSELRVPRWTATSPLTLWSTGGFEIERSAVVYPWKSFKHAGFQNKDRRRHINIHAVQVDVNWYRPQKEYYTSEDNR